MRIEVIIKSVYGNETVYPVGDKAPAILALTGTKTLTKGHITALKAMGFEIIDVTPRAKL